MVSEGWIEAPTFQEAVKKLRLLEELEDSRAARRRIAWQVAAAAQDMANALERVPDAYLDEHLKITAKHLWCLVDADQKYRKLKEEAEVDEG